MPLAPVSFFFMPPIRAQNDLRRLADLEPFFNLDGLVVTAVFSSEPGLAARYDATPLAFSPPSGFLPALRCQAGDFFSRTIAYFMQDPLL